MTKTKWEYELKHYDESKRYLVATNEQQAELWRKQYPGVEVYISQRLPEALPSERWFGVDYGYDAIPTQSKDSEEK